MSDPFGKTQVPDLDAGTYPEQVVLRSLLAIDRGLYPEPYSSWLEHLISYREAPRSSIPVRQGAKYTTLNETADTLGLEGHEGKKARHTWRKIAKDLQLTQQQALWIKRCVQEGRSPRGLPDAPGVYRGSKPNGSFAAARR